MITGLRTHRTSFQNYYKIRSDISVFGKSFGGGFPIDLGKVVAFLIVAQLMKVETGSTAMLHDDTHLVLAVLHGKEGVAHDRFVVWIDPDLVLMISKIAALPKTERRLV